MGNNPKTFSHGSSFVFHKMIKRLEEYANGKKQFVDRCCKKLKKKMKSILGNEKIRIIILILVVVFCLIFVSLSVIVLDVYKKSISIKSSIGNYATHVREKDFEKADKDTNSLINSFSGLKRSYDKLSVFRVFPFFGNYYKDGEVLLSSSENFLSILQVLNDSFGNIAKDNLAVSGDGPLGQFSFLVQSAPEIASKVGEIKKEVVIAQDKLSEIKAEDYPEKLFGKNIRLHIKDFLIAIDNCEYLLSRGNDLISQFPQLAGFEGERKYLIVFQNNKELRPTGGFITAYSVARVQSGEFQTEESNDIYNLDDKYTPDVPAPMPIIDNIEGPYLENQNYRLRDMNWNPDFPASMELFLQEISDVGMNDISGVIAVDTQVLVDIIDVIGEINVPGYGGYSNNIVELCDCEQIIYELEHFADREGPIVWSENEPGKIVEAPENYDDRKKIIGPMMDTIIENTFNLRPTKYPALFNAIIKSINEKHILVYMVNNVEEKAIEEFGASGKVSDTVEDYLYVNDANLGGKKANLYVTHQVDQIIEVDENGLVTKTIKLTYRNPKPQNNWLNTVLPNYVRIYVPKGSELLEFTGLDYVDESYEELGKTVFAGKLTVRPMGVTVVTVKYDLPFTVKDSYNLYLQKQPGKNSPKYSIEYFGEKIDFGLNRDKEITINF